MYNLLRALGIVTMAALQATVVLKSRSLWRWRGWPRYLLQQENKMNNGRLNRHSNLKNEKDPKIENNRKNEDNFKNENNLKNEEDLKNENNLKNEDDLKFNLFAPPT